MKITQRKWQVNDGWLPSGIDAVDPDIQLVLIFGSGEILKQQERIQQIERAYPNAFLMGCSTAGEIMDTRVFDGSIVLTAVHFDHTQVQGANIKINGEKDSVVLGNKLAQMIRHEGLVHAFVISEGLNVNGSDLVKGLTQVLPPEVTLTGGLSGDDAQFQKTLVIAEGKAQIDVLSIIGLYGDRLRVSFGSLGGWDPFGPERIITRSQGNVLYELDGKSALELYKRYLGESAKGLPATGLLFPLTLRTQEDDIPIVRTILSIDEKEQSMTFAGTMPQGAHARLMKANFDRLIDGASGAAKISSGSTAAHSPDLAVLISCVGRKLILKQRIEEEVEAVREILGQNAVMTGFYSYGEISPFKPGVKCGFHNQTMTITTFTEM